MEINDRIKFKFRGMKTVFRVMGTGETINKNSITSSIISHGKHISADVEYDSVIKLVSELDPTRIAWFRSQAVGESIAPHHTCRVYLEQLTNI